MILAPTRIALALLFTPPPTASVGAGAPMQASADASASRREEAARAFAQGERAWAKGDYAGATVHFSRAQALVPHPDTLYNLGLAQRKAGDPVGAYATFTELSNTAPTKTQRREAEAARARVRAEVAVIEVRVGPSHRVCLDDAPLPDGERAMVKAGDHVITIDGAAMPIALAGGETRTLERVGKDDAAPRLRPTAKVLLGTSIAAALGAAGLGVGAGVSEGRGTSRGLAFGAVALASAAAVGTIAVLATARRSPRPTTRTRSATTSAAVTPAAACGS